MDEQPMMVSELGQPVVQRGPESPGRGGADNITAANAESSSCRQTAHAWR